MATKVISSQGSPKVNTDHIDTSFTSLTGEAPVSTEWILITKRLAQQWMRRERKNRALSQVIVDQYATMMEKGTFKDYHPIPIVFDHIGRVINGQHRLEAIIITDKSYHLLVVRFHSATISDGMAETIDRGKIRTTIDLLKIALGESPPTIEATAARYAMLGQKHFAYKINDREYITFFAEHRDSLHLINTYLHRAPRMIRRAIVIAPLLRASYHVNDDQLKKYCEILKSGEPSTDIERAIIPIRDKILTTLLRGNDDVEELYGRIEWSIKQFSLGRAPMNARTAMEELFPWNDSK